MIKGASRRAAWPVLLAIAFGVMSVLPPAQAAHQDPNVAPQTASPAKGEVRPAPLAPRERVGLGVFLACLWLIIAFLIFFLRQRIREADRVFRTGLYQDAGGEKKPRKL